MNESLLDRMVDGELSPTQQRELLARLDDDPGGWRRLALAFVEAQVLRNELPKLATASRTTLEPATSASRTKAAFSPSRLMTLAACLAVAFVIGLVSRDVWRDRSGQNGSGAIPFQSVASDQPNPAIDPELLRLVDVSEMSPDWVRSRPNIVPPRIRHDLERSGHRVEQRRVFFPVWLDDGQPAVVPIDEAEVQYVGERVIQ